MSNLELPPPLDSEYLEIAWGINKLGEDHKPLWIARPIISSNDSSMDYQVKFEILYSGICHTDLHWGKNHMPGTFYPMVCGHELLGQVTEIGAKVTKFKLGDFCAVGWYESSNSTSNSFPTKLFRTVHKYFLRPNLSSFTALWIPV